MHSCGINNNWLMFHVEQINKSRKMFYVEQSRGEQKRALRPSACRKTLGLIRGHSPLWLYSDLATQGELPRRGKRRPPGGCASERMKTQRFSYFADFAARRPAAAGQFRPVSRGGTSCFLREAKPVKLKKVAFSHFFDTLTRVNGMSHLLENLLPYLYHEHGRH